MPSVLIDQIRLTHVRIPLVEPFVISNGVVAEKDAIVVELRADGAVGLGEASPMTGAFYSHHTPASTWAMLTERLVPTMNDMGAVDLAGRWLAGCSADPFASCGIDTALWDLAARMMGVPLWAYLGGDGGKDLCSGLAVGICDSTDSLLKSVDHYVSRDGYRRVKIKVQPGWDVEPLQAVRDRFGDIPLMVDANCAYRREDIDAITSWDRFGLMMIEQPLPSEDLEGHAELARRCHTPVCLDESAATVAAVEQAIARKSARIINIKLQRVGSFAAAKRIHELTRAADISCWMGTMPELGIGAYAAMHFAKLPNVIYPTDVESSSRWFIEEITEPPVTCQNGLLALPPGPGLGVVLNRDIVDQYKVQQVALPMAVQINIATDNMNVV